jgi:DNA repair exonuclease SbcCD ATPase subunit
MARIENKDLFAGNLGKPAIDNFKELNVVLNETEKNMKDLLKVTVDITKTVPKNSREIKDFNKAVTTQKQAVSNLDKIEKQRQATLEKIASLETKQGKALERTKLELQKKRQATKQAIKEESKLGGQYEKNKAKLNRLAKELKEVAFVEGKNAKATRKLAKEYDKLRSKVFAAEKVAGEFQRNVGNYPKIFGKAAGAVRSLGLAFGGAMIIRNVLGTISDFQTGVAELASVLGKSRSEIKALSEDAKRLGASTSFTAKQVTELQTAFAKLGFSEKEIIKTTEATLQLAAATNSELGRAAEVAASTVRGFGLDAEDTQRVVDVMAKSFSSSSLDMEKFATAMASVAPAAKSAGFSIEETTSLIGTITDAGIDASTAGTALRNIFLTLAETGMTFEEAMSEINNATNKNAKSLKLFGKRGAVVAQVIAENTEKSKELEKALINSGGAAEKMAKEQLDTLSGRLKLLGSAWEGFVLSLEDGEGVIAKTLNKAIELTTNLLTNLSNIGKTAEQLTKERINANIEIGKSATRRLLIQQEIIANTEKSNSELEKGNGFAKAELSLREQGLSQAEREITLAVIANQEKKRRQEQIEQEIKAEREKGVFIDISNKRAAAAREEGAKQELKAFILSKLRSSSEEELVKLTERRHFLGGELVFEERLTVKLAEQELQRRMDIGEAEKEGLKTQKDKTKELEKQKQLTSDLLKLQKELNKETKVISDIFQEEINQIIIEQERLIDKELQEQIQTALTNPIEVSVDRLEILINRRHALQKKAIEDERDLLLSNASLTVNERELIEVTYQNKLRNLELKRVDDINDANDEIADAQLEGAENANEAYIESLENGNDAAEKALQDRVDLTRKSLEILTQLNKQYSESRLEDIDKELEASKKMQDTLASLAQQGVSNAEDSIIAEKKKQAELELQKKRELERVKRVDVVIAGIEAYSANIEKGQSSGEAISNAIKDIKVLSKALQAIDFFFDGTEDTGTVNNPLDTNGGRLAVLHDNERVMTAEQNKKVSGLTNWELANLGEMYKNGNMNIDRAIQVQRFQDNTAVLRKFDELKNEIKNVSVDIDIKYDTMENAWIKSVNKHNVRERLIKKDKGIWK